MSAALDAAARQFLLSLDMDGRSLGEENIERIILDCTRDAFRAFLEHPDLVISYECRQTLRAHLEAK